MATGHLSARYLQSPPAAVNSVHIRVEVRKDKGHVLQGASEWKCIFCKIRIRDQANLYQTPQQMYSIKEKCFFFHAYKSGFLKVYGFLL